MPKQLFITGISTDVGKTIASAIVTEALKADYWKPIQAGDLEHSDTHKVQQLISNTHSQFHPNSYALKTPMSPHAAAAIDGLVIQKKEILPPDTTNHLVIEGAGGLLVPLNDSETVLDLIQDHHKVIVVSRHYLGSINHTLLTLRMLQAKGLDVALLFSGNPHPPSETVIQKMTGVRVLGNIYEEKVFSKEVIARYAATFREVLCDFINA
jgi:dethiobiotin synthetase